MSLCNLILTLSIYEYNIYRFVILVIYGYKQSPKLLSYKHKHALFNENICYVRLIKTVLSRGKKFSSYSHSLRHSYMHTVEKPNVWKRFSLY